MKLSLLRGLIMLCAVVLMASCSSSKKQPSRIGKVIILKEGKAAGKDNGLHKGWYKNPNNPHYPRTTNPGHTKSKPGKGKAAKGGKVAKGKKK
ncbi:hypothetical protein [Pontibacter diazotrophicus]|nr:hypothetical protein [Pontibacter diazotrophicus]